MNVSAMNVDSYLTVDIFKVFLVGKIVFYEMSVKSDRARVANNSQR